MTTSARPRSCGPIGVAVPADQSDGGMTTGFWVVFFTFTVAAIR